MNQKAAKLARRVNRRAGTLGKRGSELPHKLPRKVKRWWAGLDHRTRGRAAAHWRAATPHPLDQRAVEHADAKIRAYIEANQ